MLIAVIDGSVYADAVDIDRAGDAAEDESREPLSISTPEMRTLLTFVP